MSVSEEGILIGQTGCQTGTVYIGQTGCVFPPCSPVTTETFWTSRTEPTVPLYQREMGRRGGDGLPFYCFVFSNVCVCVHRDKKHVLSVCVCVHTCACVRVLLIWSVLGGYTTTVQYTAPVLFQSWLCLSHFLQTGFQWAWEMDPEFQTSWSAPDTQPHTVSLYIDKPWLGCGTACPGPCEWSDIVYCEISYKPVGRTGEEKGDG